MTKATVHYNRAWDDETKQVSPQNGTRRVRLRLVQKNFVPSSLYPLCLYTTLLSRGSDLFSCFYCIFFPLLPVHDLRASIVNMTLFPRANGAIHANGDHMVNGARSDIAITVRGSDWYWVSGKDLKQRYLSC